ncbi:MAG: cortex morphogenetic protein CmpA [Bacilli bacterium]
MPSWLKRQIQRAFLEKNRSQIRVLNQCWYFYREKVMKEHTSTIKES